MKQCSICLEDFNPHEQDICPVCLEEITKCNIGNFPDLLERNEKLESAMKQFVNDYESNQDKRKIHYMSGHYYDEFKQLLEENEV